MMKKRGRKKRKKLDVRGLILLSLGSGLLLIWMLIEWRGAHFKFNKERLNLLFVGKDKPAKIMSIDFVTKKVSWLEFGKESLIPTRSGGYYQIGKLVSLAEYEQEPVRFILSRFQGFAKLPLDGYCLESDWIWSCQKSNLNLWDKLVLSYVKHSYLVDKWESEFWLKQGIAKETDEGLSYDELRLENLIKQKLFDWSIAKEGLAVAIIDESGESLGRDLDGVAEGLGMRVVMNRQENGNRDKTKLMVSRGELKKSLTVKRLQRLTGVKDIKVGKTDSYRAEVVVLIGRDLGQLIF